MRAFGLLPHANVLGGLLAAGLPFVVGLLLRPDASGRAVTVGRAGRDALLLLSMTLMVAGIVLSFSRSAWLGLLCGGLYLVVRRLARARTAVRRSWTKRGVLVAASIGLVAGGLLLVEWDAVSVRLQPASNGLEQASIQQRLTLLELSYKVISWRPLTGVGGGNFALAANQFLPPNEHGQSTFNRVHNTYLMAQAELGPLGAVTWLALMLVPVLGLLRSKRRRARAPSATSAAPLPLVQDTGQAVTTFGSWASADDPSSQVGAPLGQQGAVPGAPHGHAPAWTGPAGCSLVVVAVVGLLDWYIWIDEPVAVLWVIALALFTAPLCRSDVPPSQA
jgi:O-antigen ligase